MPQNTPLVSIVVLNWNGLEDTKACLNSIEQLTHTHYEIILVDNGSNDGSKEYFGALGGIVYVDNPINRGFSGGQVDAIKVAKGEFVLLVNNDALVKPNLINKALRHFDDESVAAVGGRVYRFSDEHPAYEETNPFYSYQRISPITAEAFTQSSDLGETQEVNTVSGACVMIRKSVIDELGYFFEPFFAYYEETDLFARYKRGGYKLLYDPAMMIWHKDGASTKGRRTMFYYLMFRNRLFFAVRNFDQPFLRQFLKRYTRTTIKSGLRFLIRGNSADFAYCRAWIAAFWHLPSLLRSRKKLGAQLSGGYNRQIIREAPESLSVAIDCSESVENLAATLSSLDCQILQPTEIIVIVSPKTKQMITPISGIRYATYVDGNAHFQNFATVLAKYNWILCLHTGDILPEYCIDSLMFSAITEAADVAYIGENKNKPSFKDLFLGNPIGRIYLIRRRIVIASGGLDPHSAPGQAHHRLLARLLAHRCKFAIAASGDNPVQGDCLYPDSAALTNHERKELAKAYRKYWIGRKILRRGSGVVRGRLLKSTKLSWLYMLFLWIKTPRIDLTSKRANLRLLATHALKRNRGAVRRTLHAIRDQFLIASRLLDEQESTVRHFDASSVPIFIICRDRLQSLKLLVDWLERANYWNIVFVDNDSVYPPLVRYLETTNYQVLRLEENLGHTALWDKEIASLLFPKQFYVVTDPDIVPTENTPHNAIDYLHDLLQRHPAFQKAGLGLKIDDLPPHYALRDHVVTWEQQFTKVEVEAGVYDAGIDTTFALYRPHTGYFLHPSLRTSEPYVARHLPWYDDSSKLSEEEEYYRARTNSKITSWNVNALPERYQKELNSTTASRSGRERKRNGRK